MHFAKNNDPIEYLNSITLLNIFFFIATNEYLEEIDLSWNHIRQKGAFAIAKSLKVYRVVLMPYSIYQ